MIKYIGSLAFLILLFLSNSQSASAQGKNEPSIFSKQLSLAESLPEIHEGDSAGTVINASNIQNFSKIIIPEMYPLVRGGQVELDSAKGLRVKPVLPDSALSKDKTTANDFLNSDGSLKEGFRPNQLLPFGSYDNFKNEKDAKFIAHKVLHNVNSNLWSRKYIEQNFNLIWLQENKVINQVRGNLKRVYPLAVNPEDKSIQNFRERITLTAPSSVAGYSWLTFRFFSADEDMLWVNSVAIGKVRQLTGSNRSDSIFKSAISLDDFFTWSGKTELLEPRVEGELIALVPFSDYEPQVMHKTGDTCYSTAVSNTKKQKWNFESKKYSQSAAWLPTGSIFIPRKLVKLELVPKDPYSLYGRQTLYVDSELMIPYYKVVYDRAGYLWKFVISGYKQSESPDKAVVGFESDYVVVEDRKDKIASILDVQSSMQCGTLPADVKIADFDPQKLVAIKSVNSAKKANNN